MGLKHSPRAIGEDLENSPCFMPWAYVGTNNDYGMAQQYFLQQTCQYRRKAYCNQEIAQQ